MSERSHAWFILLISFSEKKRHIVYSIILTDKVTFLLEVKSEGKEKYTLFDIKESI